MKTYLALLQKDVGSDLIKSRDETEQVILGQMLQSEFALTLVTRISLT